MALSNKFGWQPVLTTGNKSEMATGYATLYGDMAGGFAVIKDVPKTLVYQLARYRNAVAGYDLIPQAVIDKPPSAELRPDQLDTDSLPPYEVLDPILEAYVEDDRSIEEIVAMGFDEAVVRTRHAPGRPQRVQAPPGAARHQDHAPRLRPRPPPADHQPLPALVIDSLYQPRHNWHARGLYRIVTAGGSSRRRRREMSVSYLNASPYIPVKDVAAAIAFYEGVLGLEVRTRFGDPLSFAIVAAESASITLTLDTNGSIAGRATCYLTVSGVDELFERCKAGGANLDSDLAVRDYGMKDFIVHDPDENHILIGERV